MMETGFADLDMIEELRLRRWARENFAESANREESLHPIVQDEMRRMDAERGSEAPAADCQVTPARTRPSGQQAPQPRNLSV